MSVCVYTSFHASMIKVSIYIQLKSNSIDDPILFEIKEYLPFQPSYFISLFLNLADSKSEYIGA